MALHAGYRPRWARAVAAGLILLAWLAPACGLLPGTPKPPSYVIGVVNYVPALNPVFDAFKIQMATLNYREGQNVTYVYPGPANTIEQLDGQVKSLLSSHVVLILALSTPAARAAYTGTLGTSVPVVFAPVTDPVAAKVVTSLSHPGGNLTGITNGGSDGRRLQWLLKADPRIKRIFVPYSSADASPKSALIDVTGAAAKLGVELVPLAAPDLAAMLSALANIPDNIDAVFMLPDGLAITHIDDFVQAANRRHLPLSAPTTAQVNAGALMSFGVGLDATGKEAAGLADQILRGAKPADLPVQTAEFTLAVNLKAAQAISLTVPDEVLSQADVIIR